MIVSKRKHESIVSMKDADIKILENKLDAKEKDLKVANGKLEGVKDLLKKRDFELYETNQEANKLSNEVETLKTRNKDKDIAINYLEEEKKQLIADNERMNNINLTLHEDNSELQKEINSYKQRLRKIDDLKVQYKSYIDKVIDINVVSHKLTRDDVKKFLSNEGIEGIVKLYMIASMM